MSVIEVGDQALVWGDDDLVPKMERVEAAMADAIERIGDVTWVTAPHIVFANPTPAAPTPKVGWYGAYEKP